MPHRDNTARLAEALWSTDAKKLEPAEFQARFDAIYSVAEGIATHWQLGGAANDYLRARPNSIAVPTDLATMLLASRTVDGRIIGLKLLNRCSSDVDLILQWICRALESKHQDEVYGGLHELSNLLDSLKPPAVVPVDELLASLLMLRSSRDAYIRDKADNFSEWLGEISSHRTRESPPNS